MSPQPLDYAGPIRTPSQVRKAWAITACCAFAWVIANAVLFAASHAVSDGFQGMGIEAFGSLALNALVVICALALSIWIGRTAGIAVLAVFLVLNVLFPGLALGATLWLMYG